MFPGQNKTMSIEVIIHTLILINHITIFLEIFVPYTWICGHNSFLNTADTIF